VQHAVDTETKPWQDPSLPATDRVTAIIATMTLREKIAQLFGVWVGAAADGGDVAPHQHDMNDGVDLDALLPDGLGQLTRPFGTAPVDPAMGIISLAKTQQRIMRESRFGIPAIAHEECLAGFTAWGATAYPVPLAWGATFNPALVERMAARIGESMHAVGVHQGLAPVLDVTRDPRWGRTEETIGEDPYLVATIATAYVRGLESSGIIATLKHFIGYSASKAGRNLGPVSMGQREFNDVMVPPFEMAVRETGVRSVMHAYTDVDGVPSAADEQLLTGLLRESWGFTGTVVADYFGIAFLHSLHGVAGSFGEAASIALRAGVDVELPTVKTFGDPLVAELESGRLDEALIDRAVRRVLIQKAQLGMLDPGWSPLPAGWSDFDLDSPERMRGRVVLDGPQDRSLARQVAEESIVLLSNDGTLPVSAPSLRIAVVGPCADDPMTLLGCYSFPSHVGALHPELPLGIELPPVIAGLVAEFPNASFTVVAGCAVSGDDRSGIANAVSAVRDADLAIAVLGDRSGLFGRGTSGEGCDAESMRLPGVQQELLDAVLDTDTPVVLALVAGRPYALASAPERAAAIVQTFFPGEEGAAAIAGILSGRIAPSGRLPVSIPARPGGQPTTYLAGPLGRANSVSNIEPTARYAFGHGLSYTTFDWSDLCIRESTVPTDGVVRTSLTVRNTGQRSGTEIVQLYLHDPVASVVRPVNRLIGYARMQLESGEARRLEFEIPADLAAFTGRDGVRIVEPGELELRFAASSQDVKLAATIRLTGVVRAVDHNRALHCIVTAHAA
jgi:beta-xylosidase